MGRAGASAAGVNRGGWVDGEQAWEGGRGGIAYDVRDAMGEGVEEGEGEMDMPRSRAHSQPVMHGPAAHGRGSCSHSDPPIVMGHGGGGVDMRGGVAGEGVQDLYADGDGAADGEWEEVVDNDSPPIPPPPHPHSHVQHRSSSSRPSPHPRRLNSQSPRGRGRDWGSGSSAADRRGMGQQGRERERVRTPTDPHPRSTPDGAPLPIPRTRTPPGSSAAAGLKLGRSASSRGGASVAAAALRAARVAERREGLTAAHRAKQAREKSARGKRGVGGKRREGVPNAALERLFGDGGAEQLPRSKSFEWSGLNNSLADPYDVMGQHPCPDIGPYASYVQVTLPLDVDDVVTGHANTMARFR